MKPSSNQVLGIPIDSMSYDDVVQKAQALIKTNQFHYIVTLNPEIAMRAQSDPGLMKIIQGATYRFADGTGVVWASQYLNKQRPNKITGVDLVEKLLASEQFSIYLVGSAPGVVDQATLKVLKRWPKTIIKGSHHGYFLPAESSAIIEDIKTTKPDLILVGMGCPRQDYWIEELEAKLNFGIAIGVGGAIDVLSGTVARAPKWVQKMGFEWLYRTVTQPRRFKRLPILGRFVLCVLNRS